MRDQKSTDKGVLKYPVFSESGSLAKQEFIISSESPGIRMSLFPNFGITTVYHCALLFHVDSGDPT